MTGSGQPVQEALLTKASTVLLQELDDSEHSEAWGEFDARYRPVLVCFAQRLGFEGQDVEEVAQGTLVRFLEQYRQGRFDRSRGRVRSWLFGIAQGCMRDLLRARARRREVRGESAIRVLPEADLLAEMWDAEWREAVTQTALGELKQRSKSEPQTVRAFEMLVLEQRPVREVAASLGMTANSVYLAKHRSIQRLRAIVTELEVAF